MNSHVEMEHHRGVLIVRLSGELDHHAADYVRMDMDEAIMRGQVEHLILSLKEPAVHGQLGSRSDSGAVQADPQ